MAALDLRGALPVTDPSPAEDTERGPDKASLTQHKTMPAIVYEECRTSLTCVYLNHRIVRKSSCTFATVRNRS